MSTGAIASVANRPVLWTVGIGGFLFLVSVLFLPMRFLENDDVLIMMLLNGDYSGEPNSLTVFQNLLLSQAIAALYAHFPGIPWYPSILVAALSLSAASLIVFRLVSANTFRMPDMLVILTLLAVISSLFVQVQYTTVAGLATAAGLNAVLSSTRRSTTIFGAGLLLFGCLLRLEAAALVLLIMAPACLLALGEARKRISLLVAVGLTLALATALEVKSNSEMRAEAGDYIAFNALRGRINDSGLSALSAGQLPPDISENDFTLLRRFFADAGEFSQHDLAAINDEMKGFLEGLSPRDWILAAGQVGKNQFAGLALAISFVFAIASARQSRFYAHYAICLIAFLALYYVEVTAILKDRVALVALSATLVGLMLFASPSRSTTASWLKGIVLSVGGLLVLSETASRLNENSNFRAYYLSQASLLNEWSGRAIVYRAHLLIEGGHLFSTDHDPLRETVLYAGWLVNHPANVGLFDNHSALLRSDTAFFYNEDFGEEVMPLILTALEENYGRRVEAMPIAENEQGRLVRFVPRKSE